MPLSGGTRLGPYEVLEAIGAGGMGEVYKARDTRLDRLVALKVIHPSAASSAEMRERFEREARTISALDHPHICMLYDVAREGDVSFLVMQYLEGEALANTLSRGPLPLDTAMKYGAEIARALDAAHRRGIVHRDLKPGNVMVTKAGTKLLDFGLAKLASDGNGAGGLGAGLTRTAPFDMAQGGPLTGQGTILGTLHYMSPEQLEGRDVDTRSDIHAFGALLFEMLAGRRVFDGQSQASIIAAIVSGNPPSLPALADSQAASRDDLRRALDRLIGKCLAKTPDERWQSAADLAVQLQWISEERGRAASEVAGTPLLRTAAGVAPARRERIWMGLAAVAAIAAAAIAYAWYPLPAAPPKPIAFTIETPAGMAIERGPGLVAVSPDGRQVAFTVSSSDQASKTSPLMIRDIGSVTTRKFPGTEGAFQPVWSPDGRFVAFLGSPGGAAALRKVDVETGVITPLTARCRMGVAWSPTGVIVYELDGKLWQIPDSGGSPRTVLEPDAARAETALAFPYFLPGGRRFLFLARTQDVTKSALYVGSLDSTERTLVMNARSNAEYSGGYLFYQVDGRMMARPFDPSRGQVTGEAFVVIPEVRYNQSNGRMAASISESGVLAYTPGGNIASARNRRLVMFDRDGKLQQVGKPGSYTTATIAPDGRKAIVGISIDEDLRSLSLIDIDRGVPLPFTTGTADERLPLWTPKSDAVIFGSERGKGFGLYRRSAGGGATTDELLFEAPERLDPWAISPDGATLLFGRDRESRQRIFAMSMKDRNSIPVEAIPGVNQAQYQASFSPDGKWIVYGSGPGPGQGEIYIQPFPADGRREIISTDTGRQPYWVDARHIVYRSTSDDFFIVELTPDGDTYKPSAPKKMFNSPKASPGMWQYSTDARGEKFLMVAPDPNAVPEALTVIVNWVANLKRK